MRHHYAVFLEIFENMDKAIFNNKDVSVFISDINELYYRAKELGQKVLFTEMRTILKEDRLYQNNKRVIFDELKSSIASCQEYAD